MPDLSSDELAEQYGLTSAFLNAYPELQDLFRQAVSGQWTPDKFQAKFKETDFWKSHPDVWRKNAILEYSDPQTAQQNFERSKDHVRQLLGSLGGDVNDENLVRSLAIKSQWYGWTDDAIRQEAGKSIQFGSNDMLRGSAAQTQLNLNSYAWSMGIQNSDAWMLDAARNISSGTKTEQDYKNEIMGQAISMFPQFEKQLRGGMTVNDLAQPYMQSMSQILELAPGSINLFDPTIRKAMSDRSSPDGFKPLWQFQNDLRQDPRWGKTQNAQDSVMGNAHKVLQDFGLLY